MGSPRRKKQSAGSTKPNFCTECGDSLEGFWLEPGSDDIKGVIQRMAGCKNEGRFHGKFCARLWIAGSEAPRLTAAAKRTPRAKLARLRSDIEKKISAEPRNSRSAQRRSR